MTFIAGVIIGMILGAAAVAIETGGEQMYNHEHYRDDTAGLAIDKEQERSMKDESSTNN